MKADKTFVFKGTDIEIPKSVIKDMNSQDTLPKQQLVLAEWVKSLTKHQQDLIFNGC